MACKPEIQYIHHFYTHGSEAKVIELKPERRKAKTVLPKPQYKKDKKVLIYVDPMAFCGLVVAFVMLICMGVGVFQFLEASEQYEIMENYVYKLENQNAELEAEYQAGYDPDEVRTQALALGMIPVEQAKSVAIDAAVRQPEPEPTWWENIGWYFAELFA